jgi:hypothetical protein
MSTGNLPAPPEVTASHKNDIRNDISPAAREDGGSRADLFVVVAFLACFVIVVLYTLSSFVIRLLR